MIYETMDADIAYPSSQTKLLYLNVSADFFLSLQYKILSSSRTGAYWLRCYKSRVTEDWSHATIATESPDKNWMITESKLGKLKYC